MNIFVFPSPTVQQLPSAFKLVTVNVTGGDVTRDDAGVDLTHACLTFKLLLASYAKQGYRLIAREQLGAVVVWQRERMELRVLWLEPIALPYLYVN